MEQIKWMLSHTYNWICGLFVAYFGYFSPIKGVLHIMVLTILIDLFVGIVAARKRGEGIKSKKLWRTAYKLLFSIMIVCLLFSIDKEMGMMKLNTIVAWIITGFEMWSILESCASISEHKLFKILQVYMKDNIKKTTNIDITANEDKTKDVDKPTKE